MYEHPSIAAFVFCHVFEGLLRYTDCAHLKFTNNLLIFKIILVGDVSLVQ